MRKESVIDYGEYTVAEEMLKHLNAGKKKQYSVFAPLSRQEKAVDLILFNRENKKTLTIQVKSSRSYPGEDKDGVRNNWLWLNTFKIDEHVYADYYVIVGNYLSTDKESLVENKGLRINAVDYDPILLVYSHDEMVEELSKLRLKTKNKPEKFFGYKFRDEDDVIIERGFVEGHNTLNNGSNKRDVQLLKNKINEIKEALE